MELISTLRLPILFNLLNHLLLFQMRDGKDVKEILPLNSVTRVSFSIFRSLSLSHSLISSFTLTLPSFSPLNRPQYLKPSWIIMERFLVLVLRNVVQCSVMKRFINIYPIVTTMRSIYCFQKENKSNQIQIASFVPIKVVVIERWVEQ